MYGKCGSLQDAVAAFHDISIKNLFSWTIMMTAYAQNGHDSHAIRLLNSMFLEGFEMDRVVFATAIGACSSSGDLRQGRSLHSTISSSIFQSDEMLKVSLLNMYAKAGEFAMAEGIFRDLQLKNAVACTALIAAYVQSGLREEALGLYRGMNLEGVKPDKVTLITVLGACSSRRDGAGIHDCIASYGVEDDDTVASALVSMYGRFQILEPAERVFFQSSCRTSVEVWNSMLSTYVQCGEHTRALELFERMELEASAIPDVVTIVEVLGVCSTLKRLDKAKILHDQLRERSLDTVPAVLDSLLNTYRECSFLDAASRLFRGIAMEKRDRVAWNTMIAAYAENGHPQQAMELFTCMDLEGIEPTGVTYVAVLGAASSIGALSRGVFLHHRVSSRGLDKLPFVSNSVMQFYGSCGCPGSAGDVFRSLESPDEVSWNTMMGIYTQHGDCEQALALFHGMELDGIRGNAVTFTNVAIACTVVGDSAKGKAIHARIRCLGLQHHCAVGSALVAMYGKFGMLDEAAACFSDIAAKNTVSWNALLSGLAQQGKVSETVDLGRAMQLQGLESDTTTYLVVLFACSHGGLVGEALSCFSDLVQDGKVAATDEHYGCLIDLLARAGWLDRAEDLFRSMPFEPDSTSWMSLVGACKVHGEAGRGGRVPGVGIEHRSSESRAVPYVVVSNMLT